MIADLEKFSQRISIYSRRQEHDTISFQFFSEYVICIQNNYDFELEKMNGTSNTTETENLAHKLGRDKTFDENFVMGIEQK